MIYRIAVAQEQTYSQKRCQYKGMGCLRTILVTQTTHHVPNR